MRKYYDSPIEFIVESMSKQIATEIDGAVFKAVQPYAVNVDEKKLAQALSQDKERYQEAYEKGARDSRMTGTWIVYDDFPESKHCSVCHWSFLRTDTKWDFCPNCGCYMEQ
jgi:hypothetical protein